MTLLTVDTTAVIVSAIGGFVSIASLAMTLLINKNTNKIHKQINGQQELLLKATGEKEHAAGKVEGKSEQRAEGKETAAEVIKQIQADDDIQITKT